MVVSGEQHTLHEKDVRIGKSVHGYDHDLWHTGLVNGSCGFSKEDLREDVCSL
jgi:hypothetical protein